MKFNVDIEIEPRPISPSDLKMGSRPYPPITFSMAVYADNQLEASYVAAKQAEEEIIREASSDSYDWVYREGAKMTTKVSAA